MICVSVLVFFFIIIFIKRISIRNALSIKIKIYTFSFLLFYVELRAIIQGPTDLYVKTGSDINLVCKIEKGPHDLGAVFWYKGKKMIHFFLFFLFIIFFLFSCPWTDVYIHFISFEMCVSIIHIYFSFYFV